MKKILFSLFFIFLFISCVSAVNISLVDTETLSDVRGTALLTFDSLGTSLFAVDNWHGAKPNFISRYELSTAYNISTLAFTGTTLNLTTIFPSDLVNYSVSTAYITRNGEHAYFVLENVSSDLDTFTVKRVNVAVLHYTMNNFDISTLNYSDRLMLNLTGINFVAPHIWGVYVSDNGNHLSLTGRAFQSSSDVPITYPYTLNTAYLVNSSVTGTTPYSFEQHSYSSYAARANIWVSPEYSIVALIYRDLHQNDWTARLSTNGSELQLLTTGLNVEGLTIISEFGGDFYLFMQNAGTLRKYRLTDIYTLAGSPTISPEANSFLDLFVSPILNLFPDESALSFAQKIMIVLIVMFASALILLYGGSQLTSEGLHSMMLYVILIVLAMEFIFFVAIQYISIGVLIMIVLISIAVGYIAVKNHSSGGGGK